MKTYTLICYQPFGTRCPHAYTVDIRRNGKLLRRFTGLESGTHALQWVSKQGGRAVSTFD